jgi:hypothetical protein
MDATQIYLQLAPATVLAALWALPWFTLALLFGFSAAVRGRHEDEWNDRALAAMRWAGTVIEPRQRQEIVVRQAALARVSARGGLHQEFLPHAA